MFTAENILHVFIFAYNLLWCRRWFISINPHFVFICINQNSMYMIILMFSYCFIQMTGIFLGCINTSITQQLKFAATYESIMPSTRYYIQIEIKHVTNCYQCELLQHTYQMNFKGKVLGLHLQNHDWNESQQMLEQNYLTKLALVYWWLSKTKNNINNLQTYISYKFARKMWLNHFDWVKPKTILIIFKQINHTNFLVKCDRFILIYLNQKQY